MRWPGVLTRKLSADYGVIEEGLNGRTIRWDEPVEPWHNGPTYLSPCLESHHPLNLIAIMLGTNELNARFNLNASSIAQCAVSVGQMPQISSRNAGGAPTAVLLMIPASLITLSRFDLMFDGGVAKSQQYADYYVRMAARYSIQFEAGEHTKVGQAVEAEVRFLIGQATGRSDLADGDCCGARLPREVLCPRPPAEPSARGDRTPTPP